VLENLAEGASRSAAYDENIARRGMGEKGNVCEFLNGCYVGIRGRYGKGAV